MTKRLLTEDFEVLGFWYLPEKSERRIPGKLSYSEKRSILFLQEPLVSEEAVFPFKSWNKYPVIHGVTTEGEAISVLDSQTSKRNVSFNSGGMVNSEEVLSHCVVVGAHVSENSKYPEMKFFIPSLEVWIDTPAIERKENQDSSQATTLYEVIRFS